MRTLLHALHRRADRALQVLVEDLNAMRAPRYFVHIVSTAAFAYISSRTAAVRLAWPMVPNAEANVTDTAIYAATRSLRIVRRAMILNCPRSISLLCTVVAYGHPAVVTVEHLRELQRVLGAARVPVALRAGHARRVCMPRTRHLMSSLTDRAS